MKTFSKVTAILIALVIQSCSVYAHSTQVKLDLTGLISIAQEGPEKPADDVMFIPGEMGKGQEPKMKLNDFDTLYMEEEPPVKDIHFSDAEIRVYKKGYLESRLDQLAPVDQEPEAAAQDIEFTEKETSGSADR